MDRFAAVEILARLEVIRQRWALQRLRIQTSIISGDMVVRNRYVGRVSYHNALGVGVAHCKPADDDVSKAVIVVAIDVDAVQQSTHSADFDIAAETRWSIGQEWDDSVPSDFLVGTVDDVQFYSYPLSAAEIKALYDNRDSSPRQN